MTTFTQLPASVASAGTTATIDFRSKEVSLRRNTSVVSPLGQAPEASGVCTTTVMSTFETSSLSDMSSSCKRTHLTRAVLLGSVVGNGDQLVATSPAANVGLNTPRSEKSVIIFARS